METPPALTTTSGALVLSAVARLMAPLVVAFTRPPMSVVLRAPVTLIAPPSVDWMVVPLADEVVP